MRRMTIRHITVKGRLIMVVTLLSLAALMPAKAIDLVAPKPGAPELVSVGRARTPESLACSKQASESKLTGSERQRYMRACKRVLAAQAETAAPVAAATAPATAAPAPAAEPAARRTVRRTAAPAAH